MKSTKKILTLAIGLFFVWTSGLEGARPRHWDASTQEEFLKGDFQGVSITSDGRLVMAPSLDLVLDTKQALIHSLVADRSGELYIGTGNEGKIFKVPARGEGREWADLEEQGVYALAVDSANRLYAGTSPGGKIYRVTGEGRSELFYNTREKYVWDLQFDSNDNLFVATGPKGKIIRVDPNGQGSDFYDSSETHVISLTWDLEGRLLAGTAPEGKVIRFSGDRPFVLLDSPMDELRALTIDRYGNIYAAGLSFEPGGAAPAAGAKAGATATVVARAPRPAARQAQTGQGESDSETIAIAGTRKGKRLEIYRINRENLVETLYSADREAAFDLLMRSDGHLLIGSGVKGRVLAITPERFTRLVAQSTDDQVTALVETNDRLFVATSNLGKLYRLSSSASAQGSYESDVLDAEITSDWGKIRWNLENPSEPLPKIQTRSGNTAKPDKTWSDWSDQLSDASGSQVTSPSARYLQWKVLFNRVSGDNALLEGTNAIDRVEVHYLQKNVAPVVESITVHPPGMAFAKLPTAANPATVSLGGPENAHLRSLPDAVRSLNRTSTPPPQRTYVPGARSFSWTAKDPNEDDLKYSLFYRQRGERGWKPLATERIDSYYTMDGASLPDGLYEVKVVATDSDSNPEGAALEGELIGKPFFISNTPPHITPSSPTRQGNRATLQVQVASSTSSIYQLEYSVDGGPWHIAMPGDGIADSNQEDYSLTLEGLADGEHVLNIRVVDSVGNLGNARVVIP